MKHGLNLPDTPVMALHRGRIDLLEKHLSADPGDPVAALRRYEAERRPLTTDVVLANREMLAAAADAPDELNTRARRYRHASHADQRRGA